MSSPAPTSPPRRRRRLRRIVPLALGAGVSAMALTGCIGFRTINATQPGGIGPIEVALTGCGSKAAAPDACGLGNSNLESNNQSVGQALVGLAFRSDFVAPETFTTNFPDSQPFTISPSYTAELTRLAPPAPGAKWVGYISDARTYTPGRSVTARIPIIRPNGPDGSPPAGGFGVSWVLGSRGVTPEAPPTRPVSCGADLSAVNLQDITICRDTTGGFGMSGANEFAFLTPAPTTAQPGRTVVMPFTGKLAGPGGGGINFALAATTTLPGATAVTNVPSLAPPADSTTTVAVSVAVPDNARPGTYQVTLTGSLATGEKRSATANLVIPRPGTGGGAPAPGATAGGLSVSKLSLSKKRVRTFRGAAPAVLSVTLSEPAALQVAFQRPSVGRKKNGICVAPTRALRRAGAPRCVRYVTVSTIRKLNLGAGEVKIPISGRVGGRARPLGTYRLSVTAQSGGVPTAPLRTSLTVTP